LANDPDQCDAGDCFSSQIKEEQWLESTLATAKFITRYLGFINNLMKGSGASYQSHKKDQNGRPYNGNHQARQIKASDSLYAKSIHNETTDDSTDDAHYDIGKGSHLSVRSMIMLAIHPARAPKMIHNSMFISSSEIIGL